MSSEREPAQWTVHAHVDKYGPDQVQETADVLGKDDVTADDLQRIAGEPDDEADANGNMLLTAGMNRLWSLLTGAGGQPMTATATRLGAGNSTVAEAAGQTDLQAAAGAANRWFAVMDSGYPQLAAGVLTLRSTFNTGDGNFNWQEWGVDIGTPTVTAGATVNAVLFNRKRAALDIKASGAIWVFTVTLTIA